ncbi:MAG TPA: hypothetical protein VD706_03130 [Candidatus Saccharimonadales bacterium]|nr:hypothetical protein [Candidatus Saccharimonadales bacterium]
MKPQDIRALDPKTRVPNTLPVMQPGEREICTIKRHPIGIFAVYGLCGLVMIVTAVLTFALAPSVFNGNNEQQLVVAGTLVFIIITAICAAFAAISTKVYWGNSWTLTDDSLTKIEQISLFKRHSSQLSMEDVEDVTSEQNGILTRIFNFGLLRVETANERTSYVFPFCPNPNYYAAQILSVREAFDQHTRQEENTYPQPPAPQPPKIDSYEVPS